MIYHHDSALSHTSKKTIVFLNKSKINYVKSEEWMPKSTPMDYSIWDYLKHQLNKQKIEILDELSKKILYQWKKNRSTFTSIKLAKTSISYL